MARLIVTRGVDEGRQYELVEPVVTIGRHSTNTIILHDIQVSRRHLEVRALPGGGHQVRDLGSGNGTWVNGRAVIETVLRSGDTITVGQTVLLYLSGGESGGNGPADRTERVRWVAGAPVVNYPPELVRTISSEWGSRILREPQITSEWVRLQLTGLALLYQAADAVSHILDLDQLLHRLLELVLSTLEADHGCIVLLESGGRLDPRAVRYRPGVPQEDAWTVSRTIVEHVLREGKGLLISDVAGDARFQSVESLQRHHVREVICVPLRGRRETVGVLFLDTQSSVKQLLQNYPHGGKFREDHLTLVMAVAHQAAIAVEESRYHQALVQAERLAAIGQTIAALSHHIKNIMQGIRFGAEMVRTGLRDDDRDLLAKGWRLVERNQERIDQLILDMLSYSKEREPVLEPTDLNALCEDVLEVVRGRAAEAGITVHWQPAQGLEQVPCDPEGIHRALLNVVSNALEAVEGRPDAQVTVRTAQEGDGEWAAIHVTDNGPGIPPEEQEAIFQPFVSSKGTRGTGLGLPVSRKILREHGGDVLVHSAVGQGSCFTLRLPIRATIAELAQTGEASPLSAAPESPSQPSAAPPEPPPDLPVEPEKT
ncbi:MAG: ATP-binding protein [Gemmataceae bacterium]|nr:ATP-binding protein [Gemmataceae bacterium]MCS7270087.1 ATP-binding protein [Gemmataceae bacterium]MDW8243524.1 ATP-binding protein [Thermogemmata sp.]